MFKHFLNVHCSCYVLCNSMHQVITGEVFDRHNQPGCWFHPWCQHTVDISWDKALTLLAGLPCWAALPTLKWVAHSLMVVQWLWLGKECLSITSDGSTQRDGQKVEWGRTCNADKGFDSQTFTSQHSPNKSVTKLYIIFHSYRFDVPTFRYNSSLQAQVLIKRVFVDVLNLKLMYFSQTNKLFQCRWGNCSDFCLQ